MTTFKRDPKFTPASLTDHQLTRIEQLADAIVTRSSFGSFSKTWQDAEDLATWWIYSCRSRQPSRWEAPRQTETALGVRRYLRTDEAAWRYLVACILWVIACGLKRGTLKKSAPVTNNRAYWAQVRGSY